MGRMPSKSRRQILPVACMLSQLVPAHQPLDTLALTERMLSRTRRHLPQLACLYSQSGKARLLVRTSCRPCPVASSTKVEPLQVECMRHRPGPPFLHPCTWDLSAQADNRFRPPELPHGQAARLVLPLGTWVRSGQMLSRVGFKLLPVAHPQRRPGGPVAPLKSALRLVKNTTRAKRRRRKRQLHSLTGRLLWVHVLVPDRA